MAALRVTIRGFGFVLIFVICLMAAVGDVCIWGRSLGCARDDNGCCALNLGVGLIYLIENYYRVYDYYSNIIWFPLLSFRLEWSGMEKSFFDCLGFNWSFYYFINCRLGDPSTALRVTVRGFGFGLIFVICVIATVGDVWLFGRSLDFARDDDGCCALNLGVGLIYLIENYYDRMIIILIILWSHIVISTGVERNGEIFFWMLAFLNGSFYGSI